MQSGKENQMTSGPRPIGIPVLALAVLLGCAPERRDGASAGGRPPAGTGAASSAYTSRVRAEAESETTVLMQRRESHPEPGSPEALHRLSEAARLVADLEVDTCTYESLTKLEAMLPVPRKASHTVDEVMRMLKIRIEFASKLDTALAVGRITASEDQQLKRLSRLHGMGKG